ncbi:MAG: hypothetical protein HS115_11830 [Spirochaetales bacterium]|nr:hypothetical protein [Spirochaetales bacterium]
MRLILDGTDPELVRRIITNTLEGHRETLNYRWHVYKHAVLLAQETLALEARIEEILIPGHPQNTFIVSSLLQGKTSAFQDACLAIAKRQPVRQELLENQFGFYWKATEQSLTIILDGALAVQSGDHPRFVLATLNAIVNPEVDIALSAILLETLPTDSADPAHSLSTEEIDALLFHGERRAKQLSDIVFSNLIAQLDQRALQRVIRDTEAETLLLALATSSRPAVEKVLSSISDRAKLQILNDLQVFHHIETTASETAKSKIIGTIQRLLDAGEIVFDNH